MRNRKDERNGRLIREELTARFRYIETREKSPGK